jgi:flagellar motor protein MotB
VIQRDSVNFWPSLVDIIVATLMMVVLSLFVQVLDSIENQETLSMELSKGRFVQELEKVFKESHDNGDIEWAWDPGKFLKITYNDRVLFQRCGYKIQSRGQALLDLQAEMLRSAIGTSHLREVQVEGHTDQVPIVRPCDVDCQGHLACWRPSNNWELSSARAISVAEMLRSRSGLDGGLFSANAYASYRPVSPDHDNLNRRIEIKVFFAPRISEAP